MSHFQYNKTHCVCLSFIESRVFFLIISPKPRERLKNYNSYNWATKNMSACKSQFLTLRFDPFTVCVCVWLLAAPPYGCRWLVVVVVLVGAPFTRGLLLWVEVAISLCLVDGGLDDVVGGNVVVAWKSHTGRLHRYPETSASSVPNGPVEPHKEWLNGSHCPPSTRVAPSGAVT
jgi:hypothetical protein